MLACACRTLSRFDRPSTARKFLSPKANIDVACRKTKIETFLQKHGQSINTFKETFLKRNGFACFKREGTDFVRIKCNKWFEADAWVFDDFKGIMYRRQSARARKNKKTHVGGDTESEEEEGGKAAVAFLLTAEGGGRTAGDSAVSGRQGRKGTSPPTTLSTTSTSSSLDYTAGTAGVDGAGSAAPDADLGGAAEGALARDAECGGQVGDAASDSELEIVEELCTASAVIDMTGDAD